MVPNVEADACSSAQDNIVVRVHTDEGLIGIGETDTNPWGGQGVEAPGTHCMGRGLTEMLIGSDPRQPVAVWEKLYRGSVMNGRRGLGISAIGALDIALWDLLGQAEGVPVWPAAWRRDPKPSSAVRESPTRWRDPHNLPGKPAAQGETGRSDGFRSSQGGDLHKRPVFPYGPAGEQRQCCGACCSRS